MDTVTESTPQEPSYTLREAAELLGVSLRSVRRYVHSGQLEASQVLGLHGPEYRVSKSALEARRDGLATVATVDVDRVRTGVAPLATATVDTLSILATQLEAERAGTREAWERAEAAWHRIAELEAELATVRAQLHAGTPAPSRSLWDRLRGR